MGDPGLRPCCIKFFKIFLASFKVTVFFSPRMYIAVNPTTLYSLFLNFLIQLRKWWRLRWYPTATIPHYTSSNADLSCRPQFQEALGLSLSLPLREFCINREWKKKKRKKTQKEWIRFVVEFEMAVIHFLVGFDNLTPAHDISALRSGSAQKWCSRRPSFESLESVLRRWKHKKTGAESGSGSKRALQPAWWERGNLYPSCVLYHRM